MSDGQKFYAKKKAPDKMRIQQCKIQSHCERLMNQVLSNNLCTTQHTRAKRIDTIKLMYDNNMLLFGFGYLLINAHALYHVIVWQMLLENGERPSEKYALENHYIFYVKKCVCGTSS